MLLGHAFSPLMALKSKLPCCKLPMERAIWQGGNNSSLDNNQQQSEAFTWAIFKDLKAVNNHMNLEADLPPANLQVGSQPW